MDQTGRPANASVTAPDWLNAGWNHIWLPYAQMKTAPMPLPVVGGSGARIRLADGRELVDGVASWWTMAHGYNHPHITRSVQEQLHKLQHVMLGGLAHEQAYTLARRLAAALPGDLNRVFFSDSGSVAVEVAIKMAIQFWLNNGQSARKKIAYFRGAYHGDTFATMSLCDPDEGMHSVFGSALIDNVLVELPVNDALYQQLQHTLSRDDIAAVIVEPLVQGAGGMKLHSPQTLERIAKAAKACGVFLILDEIFTGFARTGTMFAMEQAAVTPDIVCLGKALTGGTLPLAATIATNRIFDAFWDDNASKALMHGPTFMGNALACAAANASLDLFQTEPRLQQVRNIETHFVETLSTARSFPNVADVRVLGAIAAIELKNFNKDVLRQKFIERGVWIRPFGNIVYTTPPLVITSEDLTALTTAMLEVTAEH